MAAPGQPQNVCQSLHWPTSIGGVAARRPARSGSSCSRRGGPIARSPTSALAVISMLLLLAACASRPVNPTSAHADQGAGYRFFTRPQYSADNENLVILAFSGGGTRAAALPILRRSSQCKAPHVMRGAWPEIPSSTLAGLPKSLPTSFEPTRNPADMQLQDCRQSLAGSSQRWSSMAAVHNRFCCPKVSPFSQAGEPQQSSVRRLQAPHRLPTATSYEVI